MSRLGGIRKGVSQRSPGLRAIWSKGHFVPTSKIYNANLVYLTYFRIKPAAFARLM